jgi:hypothetical protein
MVSKSLFVFIAMMVFVGGSPALALEKENRLAVTIDKALHFLSPEDTDARVTPGMYEVEAAGVDSLWLFQGEDSAPHLIQAVSTTHKETLEESVVVILSEGEDLQSLLLLFPNGKGLEASGSYSGIRSKRAVDRPTINPKERTSQIRSRLKGITKNPKKPRIRITKKPFIDMEQLQLVKLWRYSPRYSQLTDTLEKLQGSFDQRDSKWRIPIWDVDMQSIFYFKWKRNFIPTGTTRDGSMTRKDQAELLAPYAKVRLRINGKWVALGPGLDQKPGGGLFMAPYLVIHPKHSKGIPLPWNVKLFVTTKSGKMLVSPTTKVVVKYINSWFERTLAPIFRHDRCISCHSLGDRASIIKYHWDRKLLSHLIWGPGPNDGDPGWKPHNREWCSACHGHYSDDEWFSPAFVQGLNWTKLTSPKKICEKITGHFTDKNGNVGPPLDLWNHFHNDPRIIWAVSDGEVPQGHASKPVLFPGAKDVFLKKIDRWLDFGKPCPKTAAGDFQ